MYSAPTDNFTTESFIVTADVTDVCDFCSASTTAISSATEARMKSGSQTKQGQSKVWLKVPAPDFSSLCDTSL